MLERVHIRNFRNLHDVEASGLSRINLIGGRNNSGKTSLLEALFLLSSAGNPQVVLNANLIRGINPEGTVITVGTEHLWRQLFADLEMDRNIDIDGRHTLFGELILRVTAGEPERTEADFEHPDSFSMTNIIGKNALLFRYSGPSDIEVETHIRMTGQGFEVGGAPAPNVPFVARILLSDTGSSAEDAIQLGQLRQQKRGDVLLTALQVIEPRLLSIADSSASGVPMIWGDIGLTELVPLPIMGEGMTRLTRLVLAISSTPDGVVLVDEIENGFHHSILPDVWRVIGKAASDANAQVFATTHSYECFEAAQQSLTPDDFRYHRLDVMDGEVRAVTYEPETSAAAVRHYMEVR